MLFTGMAFALGFANQALLARHLGTVGFGELRVWFTTVMLGGLLLGEWLNRGSTYVVGKEHCRGEVVANGWAYGLVLAGLLLPICWAAAEEGLLPLAQIPGQWAMLAALIVLTVMQRGGLGVLLGEDRISLHASIPLVFISTYLLGNGLTFLFSTLTLARVVNSWAIAVAAAVAVVTVPMLKGVTLKTSREVFMRTLSVGGRGSASVVLIFLLFRSDVYLIKYFLGGAALGVYSAALIFAELLQRLPNVAGVVLLPKVIRGEDGDDVLSLKVAQGTLVFALIAPAVLAVVAQPALSLIFPEYAAAYVPLVWMLPGLVFSSFGSVLNVKLAGQGYPAITVWAPALALALNIGANLYLIPLWGLRGAAISTSIAYAVWAIIITSVYLRRSGHSWWSFLNLRPLWSRRK